MKRFPICDTCIHRANHVDICKRKSPGDVLELRFCDEERAKYRWWEKLLFITRLRCGPNARFYKPI